MPTNYSTTVYGGSGGLGSVPVGPGIYGTQPGTTEQAIGAGQLAYSQLPGYQTSLGNIGGNIASETAGQLPEDVAQQIGTAAAERGVGTGSPGSPNSTASYLDTLGLNSLELTNMGQQNLQNILPQLPGSAISQNPSFYVNPEQQYQASLEQAILRAAPDPSAVATAQMNAARAGYSAGAGGTTAVSSFPGLNLGVGGGGADAFMNSPDFAAPTVYGATGGGGAAAPAPSGSPYQFSMGSMYGGGADTNDAGVTQDPVAQILQDYPPGGAEAEGATAGDAASLFGGADLSNFGDFGGGAGGGD